MSPEILLATTLESEMHLLSVEAHANARRRALLKECVTQLRCGQRLAIVRAMLTQLDKEQP